MLAAITATTLAQGWSNDHMWGWGGWWMSLGMVLFWAALIALVVTLVRATDRDRRREAPTPTDRAREVLAERYARGEIDTDEYHERLETIQHR